VNISYRTLLITLVALGSISPAHAESILHNESTAPPEVAEAIEANVLLWANYWNNSSWKRIQDLWDPDEKAPYYLGEEREHWLIGQDGLASYFHPPGAAASMLGGVLMIPYRLRVRLVADDIAIAIWENKLDMDLRGRPPISDNFRANAVFRKKPDGWRFIHYAEAPLAPLSYIEHLYRKKVIPGYEQVVNPMDPPE
jgi:hypothetical protein